MNGLTSLLLAITLTCGADAPNTQPTAANTKDAVCVTTIEAADDGIAYGVETNDRLMEMVGRIA